MALVKFINDQGAENEVEDTSVAAEIMRNDPRFVLVSIDGGRQPISAIDEPLPTADIEHDEAKAAPVSAAMIRELMLVKEKKLWREWGYKSFGVFLDSPQVPQFNKTKFYKLRDLLLAEGDDRFDVLTLHKLPG